MRSHRVAVFAALSLLAFLPVLSAGCEASTHDDVADEGGDDRYEDVKACANGEVQKGVDVSYYQPSVKWDKVKGDGVVFAIARVSYGTGLIDSEFATNWKNIKALGLIRGTYQFFRPSQDAAKQAQIVIDHVGKLGPGDLPVELDLEVQEGVSDASLVSKMTTWLQMVEQGTGKKPIIYVSPGFWAGVSGTGKFTSYPLWVAHYGVSCPTLPTGFSKWTFWQASDKGTVAGISTKVDMDWFNGTMAELKAFAGSAPAPGGEDGDGDPQGGGIAVGGPWTSFYGPAAGVDLKKVADKFRVINIDADPAAGNFTAAQVETLKAGGQNSVISYLNVGSCEKYRSYYDKCTATGALTTPYDGYPDEMWADLSNTKYRDLIVNQVAPALVAQGADGFFLDNLEVVEHGANTSNGPCGAACAQGGLDLVWELRQKYPDKIIIMQNATSDVTRLGKTHGVDFPSLLDGISHEEVYSNGGDATVRGQMLKWQSMHLTAKGNPFWLACEEYAGSCSKAAKTAATTMTTQAETDGLNVYVTDASEKQQAPCFWSDF